jgi:hypothetical protein
MLLRQQFVVQPGITEVQWNQRLPVLAAVLHARRLNLLTLFCHPKWFAGPSVGQTAQA